MLYLSLRRATVRASVVLTALATAASTLVLAAPAQAANRPTPRSFSGYGFDQCAAPSQDVMDAWLTGSPYWAVGIYIAGGNRACPTQEALDATWVATQLRNGWRLLPITVGPQASCYTNPKKKIRINPDPDSAYLAARRQGRLEARRTVSRAEALGIVRRSTLWYDIEAYDIGNVRCRESALSFLSAWTRTLHDLGYVSGVYSSAASGIRALDDARVDEPGRFLMPDRIWFADWMDADRYRRPPTANPPSLLSDYFRDDGWRGRRMRQYRGDHDETYGGATINIDTNYLHLGGGTRPGRAPRFCGGVRVDFPRYHRLVLGQRRPQVAALQCLLRRKNLYDRRITGHYNRPTARGVRMFQRRAGLPVTGNTSRNTWVAMWSEGRRTPVLKIGSGNNLVRNVQRALNAAVHAELPVTGVFDPATTGAVRRYQGEVSIRRTGVVADPTWVRLQTGRM
ncbi:MAG: glycoside hydrolase domain-containing protein [Nocardioidaceae bacterium]